MWTGSIFRFSPKPNVCFAWCHWILSKIGTRPSQMLQIQSDWKNGSIRSSKFCANFALSEEQGSSSHRFFLIDVYFVLIVFFLRYVPLSYLLSSSTIVVYMFSKFIQSNCKTQNQPLKLEIHCCVKLESCCDEINL